MSTMTIDQILTVVPTLDPSISVVLRGDHGIGKSSIVRQIAAGLGNMPVIDRRLSQVTQGDIIGLPKVDGETTKWLPPDWYVRACDEPVVLFLDELNRAEVEVMQAAFQIVLDRELNGRALHPQTRVFAAVNMKSRYNVNSIDPALLDRFFCVDVNFTTVQWLKWAREAGLHDQVIDWIASNEQHLTPPAEYDVAMKVPTPRSIERMARAVRPFLEAGDTTGTYDMEGIRLLASGFIGQESSIAFLDHLKQTFTYSGEDILNNYSKIRSKMKRERIDIMSAACDEVVAYCDTLEVLGLPKGEKMPTAKRAKEKFEALRDVHAANLKEFIWDLEKELRPTLWQKLAREGKVRIEFIKSIHPSVAEAICNAFGVPIGAAGVGVLPQVHGIKNEDK